MRIAVAIALFLMVSSSFMMGSIRAGKNGSRALPSAPASLSQDDLQALRRDVQRMKALVQQMQSNLAFVDTTQSPLKHQFQLEIDMWQTVIGQMERKLNAAGAP